jgi:Na+-translocating ferredoxin:NAD+ oxidoreductase RnfG subunit
MNHEFVGTEHRPISGFIEAMWETLVALAIAAAICVGMISLSVHLNEAQIARASAADTAQAAAATIPSGPAKDALRNSIDIE